MTSRNLTVVARIKARPGKEDRVRAELMKLVAMTHPEKGCIQYDLHESNSEPGLFLFYENWTSAADLENHLQSSHISELKKQEAQLLARPVEITLWTKV